MIRPEAAPKLLMSLDAKVELIAALGVRELVVIPFDDQFAPQSPQEFIDEVLVGRLQATHVSVGENFRFGHRAAGDPALLGGDGRFETRVVPLVEVDGEIVSSSHIRALVARRRRRDTRRAFWALRSSSVARSSHGDRRGRTLGFPTANIVPDEDLVCPGHGVYAAHAGGACAAVVGRRPADVRHRPRRCWSRPTCSTATIDLYGQMLSDRFHRPAARRAALRHGR